MPLAFGIALWWVAPLRTARQLGASEGYELMKAFLVSLGHPLYREVWNDQPPLHTELVALLFRLFGPSAYGARLLAVGFGMLLVASLYGLVRGRSGRLAGLVAVGLLLASPWFLALSASVMLEVPAMAMGLAAVWAWDRYRQTGRGWWLGCSGLVFGCALQMKLTAAIFGPALAADFVVWRWLGAGEEAGGAASHRRTWWWEVIFWLGAAGVSFGLIAAAFYRGDTFTVFWGSHFSAGTRQAAASGFEFGWESLLASPGVALSAVLGASLIGRRGRRDVLFPTVLLGTVLDVHLVHRPYWYYYAVHFAAPLAWLAAVGLVEGGRTLWRSSARRSGWEKVERGVGVAGWCGLVLMVLVQWPGQVREEVNRVKETMPVSLDPTVAALRAHAAGTRWVVTGNLIAAFWARLPVPPELAVIPLKRIWSGQIDAREVKACLDRYQPELVLGGEELEEHFGLGSYLKEHYRPVVDQPPVDLYVRRR